MQRQVRTLQGFEKVSFLNPLPSFPIIICHCQLEEMSDHFLKQVVLLRAMQEHCIGVSNKGHATCGSLGADYSDRAHCGGPHWQVDVCTHLHAQQQSVLWWPEDIA